jgi:hypothetical protein
MSLQHLDAVLGFLAVILAASLVITASTQLAVSLFGLRGTNLRRSLAVLFESASQDRDARRYSTVIARRVLQQPLVSGSIFSRLGLRLQELPFVPADAAGKLRWAGSGIPLQPWLFGAAGGFFGWPAALWIIDHLSPLDFCAYSDFMARYVPFLNLCEHPWRSGAILGAIFGGLLSRWRLATSIRLDELVDVLDKLSAPAGGTLPDPAQRAMLVVAGETRARWRHKPSPVPASPDRMFHDAPDDGEGGVAVAVERAIKQTAGALEPRVEGLNFWFERAMERASQRFAMEARVIAVVLSGILVFGAHLDAIRLLHAFSSDAQVRAQLAASADAMIKQAEQLPRGREGAASLAQREGARSAVPDVYRTAMAAVLELPPAPGEASKPKPHHSSHSASTPPPSSAQPLASGEAAAGEVQIVNAAAQVLGEGGQALQAISQTSTDATGKQKESRPAASAKSKSVPKDREKTAAVPGEDKATVQAKLKASKALEARLGFASREDAVLWLRETLDGDPALDSLAASYEREVDADLPTDGDKLVDHSASIKRELARSGPQLIPDVWPGWKPVGNELPGLLITMAFLSLGAPLWYNLLKKIASLRPLPTVK